MRRLASAAPRGELQARPLKAWLLSLSRPRLPGTVIAFTSPSSGSSGGWRSRPCGGTIPRLPSVTDFSLGRPGPGP